MKRVLSGLKLSVLAALAACVMGGTAHAQSFPMRGTFTLPYEVRWRLAVLPPGEYTIDIASRYSPALVRSSVGHVAVILVASLVDRSNTNRPTSLQVTQRENQRLVYALNWREGDLAFVYGRLTKAERRRAATVADAVTPLAVMARK